MYVSSRESAINNPEGVQESMAFMEVSEPRGPVRAKGRFERRKKKVPDKGKLLDSVRRDGRAREDMSNSFNSVRAKGRITFTKGIGVDRTKTEFTFLGGEEVVEEFGAKRL